MPDPMLVEFLREGISYAIDDMILDERAKKIEIMIDSARKHLPDRVLYTVGVLDGLDLALSVLDTIRKEDIGK